MSEFDISFALSDSRVLVHLADRAPFWLWSDDGASVYIANSTATKKMGAVGSIIIGQRTYGEAHPFAAQVRSIARGLKNINEPQTISLVGVGSYAKISKTYIATKLAFQGGGEAILISSKDTKLSIDSAIDFVHNFPTTAFLFSASGDNLSTSRKAVAMATLSLDNLLGVESAKVWADLKKQGKSDIALSTGKLHIHFVKEIDAYFCSLVEPKVKVETPKRPTPKLIIDNDKAKHVASILDSVIDFMPPKKAPALVEFKSEDESVSISGTLPPKFQKIDPRSLKKLRFTWSCDENNRLLTVSHELAECVGEESAAIIGKTWEELLKSLINDKEGSISKSLQRRDTWSGHSVHWKIIDEPTLYAVVDIAALPMFDRVKGFQGYRGFGMVRDYGSTKLVANDLEFVARKPTPSMPSTEKLSEQEVINFNEIAKALKPVVKDEVKAVNIQGLPLPLMDDLPVAVVIYRDNEIYHVNKPFLEWSGYATREEFEMLGGTARLFSARHLSEEDASPQQTMTLKTGEELPISVRLLKTNWQGSSALALVLERASTQPVKDAPSELEPSTLDLFPESAFILSSDGKVKTANKAALKLFDATIKGITGKMFTGLIASESVKIAQDALSKRSANGVPSLADEGVEVLGQTKKGKILPLFMRLHLLPDATISVILSDISLWKEREETLQAKIDLLQAKEAQQSAFIAALSHEIRTPLNAIIGFSETMTEGHFGKLQPDVYQGYAGDIKLAGAHLLSLVNDMLDLAKLESGKMPLTFEALDINTIIEGSVNLVLDLASKKKIIVRKAFTRPLSLVMIDERSLKQALLNLLTNALKYTPQGGQIVITSLLNEAQEVVIRVRDTGIGMSQEQIRLALEPYGQPHLEMGGTGLGLPLTKALVEAQHARFAIASEPEQGTIIEITFPHNRIIV